MFIEIKKLDANHKVVGDEVIYIETGGIVKVKKNDHSFGDAKCQLTISLSSGDTHVVLGEDTKLFANLLLNTK